MEVTAEANLQEENADYFPDSGDINGGADELFAQVDEPLDDEGDNAVESDEPKEVPQDRVSSREPSVGGSKKKQRKTAKRDKNGPRIKLEQFVHKPVRNLPVLDQRAISPQQKLKAFNLFMGVAREHQEVQKLAQQAQLLALSLLQP